MAKDRVTTRIPAKLLLVAVSVAATLAAVEFLLFPLLLPWMPLKLHIYLADGVRPLAQSSKRAAVPRDYVLLVGDSYAQGRGDWLLESDPNRNPPFHSAHVIQALTGRDVVSFARGGTGSIRGLVEQPIAHFRYLRASPRFRIEAPDVVVAYFYAGNDLFDTLLELWKYFRVDADPESELDPRVFDPAYFRAVVEREGVDAHPLSRRAESPGVGDALPFLDFLANLVSGELGGRPRDELADSAEDVFPRQRQRPDMVVPRNALRVRGSKLPLAVALQGPGLDLDEEQTRTALYAFDQSLQMLRDAFPDSELCLVYVPSPAACYEHAADPVLVQNWGSVDEYPRSAVGERSRELRDRVGGIAARDADRFVDATPELQEAARRDLIHGPVDMRHLNRKGYHVLGRAAARCLAD